ncbi:hypothetical protein ACXPWS_26955 [Mycobacterium sp. BMJ-28]
MEGIVCWSDIGDGIESGAEWLDNWGEETLGLPGMFTDWTTYDGEYDPSKGKIDLSDMPGGNPLKPLDVAPGSYTTVSFDDVYDHMKDAGEDITSGHGAIWETIANKMSQSVRDYRTFLEGMKGSEHNWVGSAADAAKQNIDASFVQLNGASQAATGMVHLSPAFATTIGNVVREVVHRKSDYDDDMNSWPEHRNEIKQEYDTLAQQVMTNYAFNIGQIAARNPDLTGGVATPQNPGPVAPTHRPNIGGGGGVGGGGGISAGGAGKPDFKIPDKLTASPPGLADPGKSDLSQQTTPQSAMPELPTDALSDAAGAAKDAAGQATDAVKQAVGQALSGINDPQSQGLPEGMLGLGPNGLRGEAAKGLGAGGGAKGGGGPGMRSAPLARNMGVSAATPASGAGTPMQASRAGLSGGAGSGSAGGAGAPAAGHRGGGADGSVHKANKALRRKKNGEEVIGATEAVVAVVGDEARELAEGPPTAPADR